MREVHYRIILSIRFCLILNKNLSKYDTGKRGCTKVFTLVHMLTSKSHSHIRLLLVGSSNYLKRFACIALKNDLACEYG